MEESWRPRLAREVTLADTLLATLAPSPSALGAIRRAAFGPAAAPSRQGAAIDALEGPRGGVNTPGALQVPFTGIVDAAEGNTRVTRAEVEVDQHADGTVRRVRVVRTSGLPGFDAEALAAVREALPLQPPVAMPGGRRSRWSLQVVVSRDPFVPGVGIAFDESTGWFEVHYPGRRHLRSRVWLEDVRPLGG
jgi:TonB family protein